MGRVGERLPLSPVGEREGVRGRKNVDARNKSGHDVVGETGDRGRIEGPPPYVIPARSSTPSRRRSSSGSAGTIGRRCSFSGISPTFFIMYLMGIGLVS